MNQLTLKEWHRLIESCGIRRKGIEMTDFDLAGFREDLETLINTHSIENTCDMPDFIMADMICGIITKIGTASKRNLDWHGCNSICHPKESD